MKIHDDIEMKAICQLKLSLRAQVRAGLAALGLRSLDELVGRADFLRQRDMALAKTAGLDLSFVTTYAGETGASSTRRAQCAPFRPLPLGALYTAPGSCTGLPTRRAQCAPFQPLPPPPRGSSSRPCMQPLDRVLVSYPLRPVRPFSPRPSPPRGSLLILTRLPTKSEG